MKPYLKKLSVYLFLILAVMTACDEEDVIKANPQNKLVAVAGEDKAIKVNDEILLDGSGSHDGNNKPFTYLWSVKTKPQGSVASLSTRSDSVKTTFTPDVAGIYVVELKIMQGSWSAMDELVLTAASIEPNEPTTVTLSENINVTTTLKDIIEDPAQPDFLVANDLEVRADLIIMPGVVVAFQENRGLQIFSGSIQAKGSSDRPIVFKGLVDSPAYWKGILIHNNSDLNEFEFVTIKQAGSSAFSESGVKANVALAGSQISAAALKVSHTVFSESGGYGFYVQGMSYLNRFSNNAFSGNANFAAYIPAHQLHKIDVVSFTGTDGLETGGAVAQENEVTWKKLVSASYHVNSDIAIKGGVTIQPGASFKMKTGVTIKVTDNGYLDATGSEAFKIIFTSETNNGYWNGLFFNSFNVNNKLKYCEISNAGLNRIEDADYPANVVVGLSGTVTVENSVIKNSLGYGLVTKTRNNINVNFEEVNQFDNLQKGVIFPVTVNQPDKPSINGTWLDVYSLMNSDNVITDEFYDVETGTWFGGAANPWEINSGGFGIYIDEHGNFTWIIAEHHAMTGCESYSAEYITGTTTISGDRISFNQNYWKSKFINSCDETQNVDTEVTPSEIVLSYDINQIYNMFTGEVYWELKFRNPDNSTFSYYRR